MEELEYTPRFNYGSKTLDKLSSPLKLKLKKNKNKNSSKSKKHSKNESKYQYEYKKNNAEKNQFVLFLRKTFKLRNDFDYEHTEIFLESKQQAFEGYPFNFKDLV